MIQAGHKPGVVIITANDGVGPGVVEELSVEDARSLAFEVWDAVREAEQSQANHRKSVSRQAIRAAHASNNRGGKP